MASTKINKTLFIILGLIFLVGAVYIFFNDEGILKYLKLKNEVNNLKQQITTVDTDNKNIQAEIDSLQNKVPAKIEKIAREKYGMIRKGEKTIKIIEK
ncbi:MAG TPA: septum formation initiator family protein [Ignavibacteriaceae bacterium]|nr:septum formation initiator family protein [Ignavibacteriaceae bacterium]